MRSPKTTTATLTEVPSIREAWAILENGKGSKLTERYDLTMRTVVDDLVLSTLNEGKSPALRKSDPLSRAQTQRALADPQYNRKAGKAFKKYKRQMENRQRALKKELRGIMGTYSSGRGRLDFDTVRTRIENKLRAGYINSFELGMRAAGVTGFIEPTSDPTIRKRIDSAIKEEMKYLTKFLDQLGDGKAKGNPVTRIGNYVESVEAAFNQGRIMAVPSMALIHWHLESGDPCPDCVLIQKFSPYTRENLPTVPRAGMTRCLNHCYCSLEVQVVDERRMGQSRRRHLSRKEVIRRIHRQQKKQMGRRL